MRVNQLIGYIDCPHCKREVPLKESKKGLVYYTCDECGQFFARTRGADEYLRSIARPDKKGEVEVKEDDQESDETDDWL